MRSGTRTSLLIPEITPELQRRMRRVRALLETLDGWVPDPPAPSLADSGLAPSKNVPCVDCNRTGKRKYKSKGQIVVVPCPSCEGGWRKRRVGEPYYDAYTGEQIEVVDEGRDRPKTSKSKRPKKFAGESYVERTIMLNHRSRHDRNGSYAQLRRVLEAMRAAPELHMQWQAVRLVYFSGLDVSYRSAAVERYEAEGVAWVASMMPRSIWVPRELARSLFLEEQAEIRKLARDFSLEVVAERAGMSIKRVRSLLAA